MSSPMCFIHFKKSELKPLLRKKGIPTKDCDMVAKNIATTMERVYVDVVEQNVQEYLSVRALLKAIDPQKKLGEQK